MTAGEWIFIIGVLLLAIALIGENKARWLAVLAVLAVGVAASHTRLHSWNIFHYYLGSRYFAELGYDQLYPCALQAFPEVFGDAEYARDLATYQYRHVSTISCTATFTAGRWEQFEHDVIWVLARLRPGADKIILLDKGYNMLPSWTGLVEPLARAAAPGSVLFWAVVYADVLALAAGILLLWCARGLEPAAVAVLFLATYWGTYGLMAGNWLQYLWLGAVLAGLSCWQLQRRGLAGALLATAAALRIFPVFLFVWPLLYPRLAGRRFWCGAAGAGLAWALVGSSTSRGMDAWPDFCDKMALHSGHIISEPLNIGLKNLLLMLLNPGQAARHLAFNQTGVGRVFVDYGYPLWIELIGLALIGLVLWRLVSRSRPDWGAGLAFMFSMVTLSRYYYQILLVAVFDKEPARMKAFLGLSAVLAATVPFNALGGYVVFQIALLAFLARFYGLPGRAEKLAWA